MIAHARLPISARRDHAAERAAQTRMVLARERALEAQLARVMQIAGRRAATAARHGAAEALASVHHAAGDIRRVMRPALVETAREFAGRLMRSPKCAHAWGAKAFGDLDAAMSRHLDQHTAQRVTSITDALRETIRRVIERAVAANLGEEATAEAIVAATSGEIGMARARRIARTEIHFAAMYAQQAAAEASPLEFEKVWLATEDARTRKSHADAHDQRVGLADLFTLHADNGATVRLRYPGDAEGPPGEIINCRCVCTYEPTARLKPQPDAEPRQGPTPGARPGRGGGPTIVLDLPPAERPEIEQVDVPVMPAPVEVPPAADEPPQRDLEATPIERAEMVVWAAGDAINLDVDGTPRVGQVLRLVGPNDLYASPDAAEVDRPIAAKPALVFGLRRPQLWRITIPAGPALPDKLFASSGRGVSVNSGVGRFGLVELRVTRVESTTWGAAAPKEMIDPADLDAGVVHIVERGLAMLDGGDLTADAVAETIARQILGARRLDGEPGAPDAVLRALTEGSWNKRALARYLERLLAGDVRDEPGPGEPATDARIVLVSATMDIAAAMPGGDYQWQS